MSICKTIYLSRDWEFSIVWNRHFRFIGFIQFSGFGKYIGITFKKEK